MIIQTARRMLHHRSHFFFFILLCELCPIPETIATKVNVRGMGASFPNDVYQAWIPAYRAHRRPTMELNMLYIPVGSGQGKASIIQQPGELEYAGSDDLLKDSEHKGNTDLVTFPTMAGGAAIAYNLPHCQEILNLTRHHLVGIYNGTYRQWNESSLQKVNPSCQLPQKRIRVIARRDNSGTTSMFTEGLSSFSPEWEQQYGIFSEGVNDSTGQPLKWNRSVLYMYGKGNVGMSGLVLSVPFSIGYMAVNTARLQLLTYARIQNKYQQFTLPTSQAIQVAMDSRVGQNLTVKLVDGDHKGAYPIASYTYFILYRTQMANCRSAVELVRYIDWFMKDEAARQDCEKKMMVPLSQKVVQRVRQEILQQVSCHGQNVWKMVLADIAMERRREKNWVVPVAVTVPLLSLLVLAMLSYMMWQRCKLVRMIDSDDWNIAIEDIIFFDDRQRVSTTGSNSRLHSLMCEKSSVSLADIPDGHEIMSQILQWPGRWRNNIVGVRLMDVKELRQVTKKLKKTMLWMRYSLLHTNLVRFYGLTEVESDRYVIEEYCAKGSMVEILQNNKYNLNNDFKFSLAADLANGMTFLHDNGVVHGSLTSSCCLIDARWTVKVGDWEYCRLVSVLQRKKNPLAILLHHGQDVHYDNATAFRHFWVAPEIIRAEFMLTPVSSADVYSFGIILQEIYTREDPYAELAETLTPRQVVRAVCNNHLRPQPIEDTPIRVRQMMEMAWADNPASRPSFEQMVKILRQNRPSRKTVLDSMMETMEEYTHHLEEQVVERSAEVNLAQQNLEDFLHESVPQHLLGGLVSGWVRGKLGALAKDGLQGRQYDDLGLLMLEVLGIDTALDHVPPQDVLMLLNDLYAGVDDIVRGYGAYRAGVYGESQLIVVGLDSENALLKQRCSTVTHLAFHLIHFVGSLQPLSSPNSHSLSFSLTVGVNVGKVVTGVVGEVAPRFVLLGEGLDVAKVLVRNSEAGRVRVSRNVFSHLETNMDFVSEDAGWIVCAGMEVESFWISLRIPRKPGSIPSEHSADSGVEFDKVRAEGREESDKVQTDCPGRMDKKDQFLADVNDNGDQKESRNQHRQHKQQRLQQQQQQQQQQLILGYISEEDERQNSPPVQQQRQQQILHLHQRQHQPVLGENWTKASNNSLETSDPTPLPSSEVDGNTLQANGGLETCGPSCPPGTEVESKTQQSLQQTQTTCRNGSQSNIVGASNDRSRHNLPVTNSHNSHNFSTEGEQSQSRFIPTHTHTGTELNHVGLHQPPCSDCRRSCPQSPVGGAPRNSYFKNRFDLSSHCDTLHVFPPLTKVVNEPHDPGMSSSQPDPSGPESIQRDDSRLLSPSNNSCLLSDTFCVEMEEFPPTDNPLSS